MAILKRGLSGEPVRHLQQRLGIEADGIFGSDTEAALKAYQKEHGLGVDGVAGPDTFAQMGLYELILLKRGSKGDQVKRLQQALGTDADGIFGGGTEEALKEFQKQNGLAVDGIAGPATLARMDLFKEITEETVRMSKLPEKGSGSTQTASASASGGKSIWESIKGLFN